jgi:large subunit ribosomal protein L6
MSRIGKQIIKVPQGIEVTLNGNTIKIKGPKGELTYTFSPTINVIYKDDQIQVKRNSDEPRERSLHGLTRALIKNMIVGVSNGFEKRLEIIGVGYRAQVSGKKVTLNLGFSHPIDMETPKGVSVEMDKEQKNIMIISGADKHAVGQFAANIRGLRPPEPYKGKGIRYIDEYVPRKAGKTAAAAGSAE